MCLPTSSLFPGNPTATFTYDSLGRTASTQINGVDFGSAIAYDAFGRMTGFRNALGLSGFTYQPNSGRVTRATAPNGMSTDFTYANVAGDFRLQSIDHRLPGGAVLSKFSYTYDAAGEILSWTRDLAAAGAQVPAEFSTYNFGYDAAGQLVSAALRRGAAAPPAVRYGYDLAGNRTEDGARPDLGAAHNALNQISAILPPTRFRGALDEAAASVTVDGQSASVDNAAKSFQADLTLSPGTHTVQITATDLNQNTSRKEYQVTVEQSASALTMAHDAAGNLIRQLGADGKIRRYEWDAANRLLAIQSDETPVAGSWRTEFSYDGVSRRVKRRELTWGAGGWTQTEAFTYLWLGSEICQKRDATGSTVLVHYLGNSEIRAAAPGQAPSVKYYYTRDHLGSVREVVDQGGQVMGRWDYDPWGVRTKLGGVEGFVVEFGFTGHHYHAKSGLHLALYRAYDANLGRWLSADPIGEAGGLNLYGYVGNQMTTAIDPLGLSLESNGRFLGDFLSGHGTRIRNYGSGDFELQEMIDSPGAEKLRDAFRRGGCKSISRNPYKTLEAAVDTLFDSSYWDSTALQVGGFLGDATNNGDGTVTYTIKNTAGAKSFLYHLPFVKNRKKKAGPFSNIEQTFTWTERTPCSAPTRIPGTVPMDAKP